MWTTGCSLFWPACLLARACQSSRATRTRSSVSLFSFQCLRLQLLSLRPFCPDTPPCVLSPYLRLQRPPLLRYAARLFCALEATKKPNITTPRLLEWRGVVRRVQRAVVTLGKVERGGGSAITHQKYKRRVSTSSNIAL